MDTLLTRMHGIEQRKEGFNDSLCTDKTEDIKINN